MKAVFFIYFLLSFVTVWSQTVNVKIFSLKELQSVVFTVIDGEYEIVADSSISNFDNNNVFQATAKGDKISLKSLDGTHGDYSRIRIAGKNMANSFKLKPNIPDLKPRVYDDNLIITAKNNILLVVNEVNLENYVAGVVESEGGPKAHHEFFKTQAVLCRTWALTNFDKHLADGFQLCDETHCQVYHHKCHKNKSIIDAAKETEGLILVDTSMSLVVATFHSNCGGQTVNSEDIWGRPRSYLQSVGDSFCVGERSAKWEKRFSVAEFRNYLKSNGFKLSSDTFAKDSLLFMQSARKAFFSIGNDSLHLKKMRTDLKLRSTFFSAYKQGKEIVLKGRGYGHGVGLCQEGAMRMARQGYSYPEIVKYYFKNINIISLKALNFFNASIEKEQKKDSTNTAPESQ